MRGQTQVTVRFGGALGFRYAYDPRRDEYAHAAAIYVATPQGRIARRLLPLCRGGFQNRPASGGVVFLPQIPALFTVNQRPGRGEGA